MAPPYPERAEDRAGAVLAGHLVRLPGGPWALWRTAALRGAGFPAAEILRLAAPQSARAAEELLAAEESAATLGATALEAVTRARAGCQDPEVRHRMGKALRHLRKNRSPEPTGDAGAESSLAPWRAALERVELGRARLESAFAAESALLDEEIQSILRGEAFREALTWQNRSALQRIEASLLAPSAGTGSGVRRDQLLVASYHQRYCMKNDTIGFFGPVGWARFEDRGEPVEVKHGDGLVSSREVFFEHWCIDALTETLAADRRLLPWLAPRLLPRFHLDGRSLYRPWKGPQVLSPEQARLLAACDGTRTAREIARAVVAEPGSRLASEEQVFRLLETLRRMGVIAWTLEVRPQLRPEVALRRRLEGIEDERVRAEALAPLEDLEEGRAAVARAGGDSRRLDAALGDLERTFTELTGSGAGREAGRMYAARGLIYEDCRRAVEVHLGPAILERLGPPLSCLLAGARWLAAELRRRVDAELGRLLALSGSRAVESQSFLAQAIDLLWPEGGPRHSCFQEVEEDFHRRWLSVLGRHLAPGSRQVELTVGDLAARSAEVFAGTGPTYSLAFYFSPDVLLAAQGEEALRRGDFDVVVGELHCGNSLAWSGLCSQHPDPGELLAAVESDTRSLRTVLVQMTRTLWTARSNISLVLPDFYRYEFADELASSPECRPLPAGNVLIEPGDRWPVARTRDGSLSFPAAELLGLFLVHECSGIMGALLPPARHTPRITVDRVVISREGWVLSPGELGFAAQGEPLARFLAVRRWARELGLPRFSFFKVPGEVKPLFLDLDSPVYVEALARAVRRAQTAGVDRITVREMLPTPAQIWLSDGAGRTFTSELRLVVLEAPAGGEER